MHAAEPITTQNCICPGRSAHNTTITTMDAADSQTTSEKSSSENETEVGETPPRPPPKKNRKSKYRAEWDKDYPCIESVRDDENKARCTVCRRAFTVTHGGLSDVKKHVAGETHKKKEKQWRSRGALNVFLVPQATPEANMVCQISMSILLLAAFR